MTVFVDNYSGMKNVKCNLRGVYTRFHLGGKNLKKCFADITNQMDKQNNQR